MLEDFFLLSVQILCHVTFITQPVGILTLLKVNSRERCRIRFLDQDLDSKMGWVILLHSYSMSTVLLKILCLNS